MFRFFREKYRFFRAFPTSLKFLILNSTIVAFGSFLVTPFLGIFLKLSLHLDTKVVGLLMAFSTLVQFGGGVFGAMAAERMGLKKAMVFALSFRSVGFLMLALSPGNTMLIGPAIFLVAAGSALYLPANRAYMILNVTEKLKPLFISISNASLSAGMAAGPLVAALLIDQNPSLLFHLVAGLFVVFAVIHQITLKKEENMAIPTSFSGLPSAFSQAGGPVLLNAMTYYLYFFFQSFIGLYLATTLNTKVFGILMFFNMLILAVVQPMFANKIAGYDYQKVLLLGFSFMAGGFSLFFLERPAWMILGTLAMTVGQALLVLRGDIEVVRRLPNQPALAFGLQRLSTGTGGFVTGLIGGIAYDYFQGSNQLNGFWLFVSLNALGAVVFTFVVLRKRTLTASQAAR